MRGYTDIDSNDEYTRITRLQNEGISCPYCHADIGHFGSCPILHRYEAQKSITGGYTEPQADGISDYISESELQTVNVYRDDINSPTQADEIRLHSLGVCWS